MAAVEINKPLADELATLANAMRKKKWWNRALTKPLLLQPVNLSDQAVMHDHPHLSMSDPLQGQPDLCVLETRSARRTDDSTILLGTQLLICHTHLSICLDQPDHQDRLNKATVANGDILGSPIGSRQGNCQPCLSILSSKCRTLVPSCVLRSFPQPLRASRDQFQSRVCAGWTDEVRSGPAHLGAKWASRHERRKPPSVRNSATKVVGPKWLTSRCCICPRTCPT
jgi:hypothetical protein